jgi:hypothetical protein
MTVGKRRRSAKDDDKGEETIDNRRKSPRIQEIGQFPTSHMIVLPAYCHVTDWLQSIYNTQNTRKEQNPSHSAEAHDYKRYKT